MLCTQDALCRRCVAYEMQSLQDAVNTRCSEYKMLCIQDAVNTRCFVYKMQCLQDAVNTRCSKWNMLFVQDAVFTRCFVCRSFVDQTVHRKAFWAPLYCCVIYRSSGLSAFINLRTQWMTISKQGGEATTKQIERGHLSYGCSNSPCQF